MIYSNIEQLLAYGLKNKLIAPLDVIFVRNQMLGALGLANNNNAQAYKGPLSDTPAEILADISFYAAEQDLLPADTATYREIFEMGIMALFTQRPSTVAKTFYDNCAQYDIKKATDAFYKFCQKNYYIKMDRVSKNIRWKVDTKFGKLDMTINLSKPEKDPKEIALQGNQPAVKSGYPKCLLCKENEGYSGTLTHPARQNLRLIPLKLNGAKWYFQYSPYVYYNEHSIVLADEHRPMKINADTFKTLLDFVEAFPHYFIGSNADLPIVGGSILLHEHYQAGRYAFPLEKAVSVKKFKVKKFSTVSFDIIRWPLTVLRLSGAKKDVCAAAAHVLKVWQKYDDQAVDILHATGAIVHNTITPIVRFKDGKYEADMVLRNNRTNKEYPWGIFHSRPQYHNIKRENIGLIEAMGMAILPGRLKNEFTQIASLISSGNIAKMRDLSSLAQHYNWVKTFIDDYEYQTTEDVFDILLEEAGNTFAEVLLSCGVFKHDEAGKEALLRFIYKL